MIGGDREGSSARVRLAVGAGLAALAVLQAWLVFREPLTAAPDSLAAAAKYREDAAQGRWGGLLVPPAAPGRAPSPPLFHAAAAAGLSVGDRLGLSPERGAALAGISFLFLLSWAVYVLASDWWGQPAGVAGAFLVSLAPPFLAAARSFSPDAALAFWVVLSYALWEKSRRFSLWGRSAALGLAAAAGALTDPAFPSYVAPIAAAALWELVRPSERGARVGAAVALAAAVLPAAPWYRLHLVEIAAAPSIGAGPRGLDVVFYYLLALKDGIGWAGLAAAAGGFVWIALRQPRNGWILASWLASSYAFWSVVPAKDPRRILPALPVLALSAAGLPFRLPYVLAAILAAWAARGAFTG